MIIKIRNFRGVSPLISAVIVIAIAFMLASLIAPYMFDLVSQTSNQTGEDVRNTITCRNMAYDFVTSYGTDGVNWNFTGTADLLEARVINTGTINIYNFSFEILVNTTSGLDIKYYDVNSSYQKTPSLPLKPGQSTILKADVTDVINGSLEEIKIRNEVCQNVYVTQEM